MSDHKYWLEYADTDYRSAVHLQTLYPVPLEIICYHCQQAGEKYLKTFLLCHNTPFPKSHDVGALCQL